MTTPVETSLHRTLPLTDDLKARRRYMVVDEPVAGNFRFGLLLEDLDIMAEQAALGYARSIHPDAKVVTAAIDNIIVRHVVDIDRDIQIDARINQVGRSSMVVGMRVEHAGNPPTHIASCYFTMVARGGEAAEESRVLPPLEYRDELEQRRAEKALKERELYRQQQAALKEPPSREEYELLQRLHLAQDDPGFSGLKADRLVVDAWERMYPEQEYVPHRIFGGYIIRRAYELSSICAELVAPNRPIIAAVNRINFFHPVRLGDKLHYTCRVVYTDESFICVEAGIERVSRDRTSKALSNSCLFTFVNVDSDLRHQPVPPIYPTTYAEDARYLAAHRSHRAMAGHYALI
ncbi:hotdog domain-containing protein [Trichlorobacter ammonificans]|uniref:Thioesterase superfamily n=1 Tax=Trichlorobacter ammonificans TaxID=2916410 RepID=A0ABM9D9Q0_9BACT|nr:hotdog domain-containing protein [Trichlorobacter ammonificans]CAH2031944.1 Thioesterase superfamily [Trichlorobacter ammonificans]